jgi:hypothetical protein
MRCRKCGEVSDWKDWRDEGDGMCDEGCCDKKECPKCHRVLIFECGD